MIVVIDNFDSFVHNLARYFRELGCETLVVRNNAVSVADVLAMEPQAVVISPGPCTPAEAGISESLVLGCRGRVPLLGVCLGHQALASALGARIVRGPVPVHGRTSLIRHDGQGLFSGSSSPLRVMRYHSLVVEPNSLPAELQVTAATPDGIVMAIQHRSEPLFGVQFHPEAVLTEYGHGLLGNFLATAGIDFVMPESAELQHAPDRSLWDQGFAPGPPAPGA